MESLFKQLLDILTEEKEIYKALLELSGKKKEAIVSSALESINRIVRDEQALVARIQDRERARAKCVMALCQLSGKKDASLQSFAYLASTQEDRDRLDELQGTLPELIAQLRALNEINRQLIESRLKYVQFVMDSMTPGSGSATYGAQGEDGRPDRPRLNLYDQKV